MKATYDQIKRFAQEFTGPNTGCVQETMVRIIVEAIQTWEEEIHGKDCDDND
jgi:hypothetical protein